MHFYHQKGLLAEPERDRSGYRRYDAAAVVELIRIRTLAEAGVPLHRVRELLAADPEEFAAAIDDIDRRLRLEIQQKRRQRQRINQLATGDSLALPPEAVAYLDHLRGLGVPDQVVNLERDAWILVAAQIPEKMATLMALKRAQLDDPAVLAIYKELAAAADWRPQDARVPALADRLALLLTAAAADWSEQSPAARDDEEFELDNDLVELLDEAFLETLPIARRLLKLLEGRGWTGWTRLEPVAAMPPHATTSSQL